MSDDRPPIFPRPDASPLLAFERFNPDGNTDEAVVFIKEDNLLRFAGKHYVVVYGLADDVVVDEVFHLEKHFLLSGHDTIFVRYRHGSSPHLHQAVCRLTVLPDLKAEAKEGLTAMLRSYSSEMAEAAKKVKVLIKEMKTISKEFEKKVLAYCPDFKVDEDFKLDLLKPDSDEFGDLVGATNSILDYTLDVSRAEPFLSKKRKSSD